MKKEISLFKDGATVRLHNKRITFKETEQTTMISFQFVDAEPDKPACRHRCHKGKIRDTFIKMSNEAMEALVYAYFTHKRQQSVANKK